MATESEWVDCLRNQVTNIAENEARVYAQQFAKQFLPLTQGAVDITILIDVTEDHLKEMGVAIGHRSTIRSLFTEIHRRATAGHAPTDSTDSSGAHEPTSDGHSIVAVSHAVGAIQALRLGDQTARYKDALHIANLAETYNAPRIERESYSCSNLRWIALSGERASAEHLTTEVKNVEGDHGFPVAFIERAFKDDGPMPFFLDQGTHAVFLMRIPAEETQTGTTIKTITNRAVFLFREGNADQPPLIVTYHRDPNRAFAAVHELWAQHNTKLNTRDVSSLAKEFFKRLLATFREATEVLETRSELAEHNSRPGDAIEELSLIQKQASVYARCLRAFEDTVRQTDDFARFKDFSAEIAEVAAGIGSKADEVAENANATINLKMALDGYRSAENMKVFTYLSIVLQPIAVATGWFGMNFFNMPELAYENAYFIFCGAVGFVILCVIAMLFWFECAPTFADKQRKKAEQPDTTKEQQTQ